MNRENLDLSAFNVKTEQVDGGVADSEEDAGEREALELLGVVSILRNHAGHSTISCLQRFGKCTLWLESTDFGWNRIKVSQAVVNGAHLWRKRSKVWVVEQTKTQRSRPSIPLQGFPAKRVQREGVMIARKQKFCQSCSLTS